MESLQSRVGLRLEMGCHLDWESPLGYGMPGCSIHPGSYSVLLPIGPSQHAQKWLSKILVTLLHGLGKPGKI